MITNGIDTKKSTYDLCIVGAGPLGIATALECEELGFSVLLLESGGISASERSKETGSAVVDESRHAPLDIAICHAFGGTSWWWGGRCLPMDPVDFEPRAFVPESGWPITPQDLRPFEEKAAFYLDCGNAVFELDEPTWSKLPDGITVTRLERWSRTRQMALLHGERLAKSASIEVCLYSKAMGLVVRDGVVVGVEVLDDQGVKIVRAKKIVLAGGALGIVKLLAEHQRYRPSAFGGEAGALGRYYMGHTHGKIADIVLRNPDDASVFDFLKDITGTWVRRRLSINATTQVKYQLRNTAFWIDNAKFHDARHGSGILSAVYLALSVPPLGRRLVAEGIRRMHVGPGGDYLHHISNIVRQPLATLSSAWKILRQRYLEKPRRPGFLIRNRTGRYALAFHGEQEPQRSSAALLHRSEGSDERQLMVDLRFTRNDAMSVVQAHAVLDRSLREAGKAFLDYYMPEHERVDAVLAQASDGYHQVGLLRMGSDPSTSVVDDQCKVHGFANLYIASTGVFPTSGQANPTFTACALAVRMARFIAQEDISSA